MHKWLSKQVSNNSFNQTKVELKCVFLRRVLYLYSLLIRPKTQNSKSYSQHRISAIKKILFWLLIKTFVKLCQN